MSFRFHFWLNLCLFIFVPGLFAVDEELEEPPTYREQISRLRPMGLKGVNPQVATILSKYYQKTFSGSYHWEELESLRYDGILKTSQGSLRFVAYKKKPDYVKVVLFGPNGGRLVFAYDGEDAWELNTMRDDAPRDMADLDALNFIRDATTGGHLLYPGIEGKRIEFTNTIMVGDQRCYELNVFLPDGQKVSSALTVLEHAEIRQVMTNNVTGEEETLLHSNFKIVDGIRVAFTSKLMAGGELVHESNLLKVRTDIGVMPWMFQRPSGAFIPGGDPVVEGKEAEMAPLLEAASGFGESFNTFGEPSPFDIEIRDEDSGSLLDDLDKQ